MADDSGSSAPGRTQLDLSHIPGHYPNIPPYPVLNPGPTWGDCVAELNGSDMLRIAGAGVAMGVAGAMGAGRLRHHWYNWYRLGLTTSTIGVALGSVTSIHMAGQRLRGIRDNGRPPVIPGYEKYKGAPHSVLHDISKPYPAQYRS